VFDPEADAKYQAVQREIQTLKDQNELRTIEQTLRIPASQAAALLPLTKVGLSPQEAMTIAKQRGDAAFGAPAEVRGGFQPGVHGSLKPSPAGGPPPREKTMKEKTRDILAIVNPIDRDAAERRMHGAIVIDMFAKSMGLQKRPE
jgi:hypothetical protein